MTYRPTTKSPAREASHRGATPETNVGTSGYAALGRWIGAKLLIRPGEERRVAFLFGAYLLLGFGLALGQGSSEALFLNRVGIAYLPHVFIGTGVLLALSSVLYMEFVDRLRPGPMLHRLLWIIAAFLLFVGAALTGSDHTVAVAAYLLGFGVISEVLVVHFNLYLSSLLDAMQAARLTALVSAGARVGAILGGVLLGLSLWPLEYTALAWLAITLITIALIAVRHRHEPAKNPLPPRRLAARRLAHVTEGVRFARRSRLLKLTGGALFLLIVLVSLQDYVTSAVLSAHFDDATALAAFFGWFYAFTNGVVLLLQSLVTGRLLRRVGLAAVNLVFPLTSLLGFAALVVSQGVAAAALARFGSLGALRAFRIPAANLFYNAIPNYMQGRGRALNLALMLPAGLVATGMLLIAIPDSTPLAAIAGGGVLLSALGVYVKARKHGAYRASLLALIQAQVFAVREAGPRWGALDHRLVDAIVDLLRVTRDEREVLAYVDMLASGAPRVVTQTVRDLAPQLYDRTKTRLLRLMAETDIPDWEKFAGECLSAGDAHLRATAFKYLWRGGAPAPRAMLDQWLAQPHPRLQAAAIEAALDSGNPSWRAAALQTIERLLASDDTPARLAGLSAAGGARAAAVTDRVRRLLEADDARVRAAAVAAWGALADGPRDDLARVLQRAAGDAAAPVRAAVALTAARHAPLDVRLDLIARALRDADPDVRRAAMAAAPDAMPTDAAGYRYACDRYFADFTIQALLARRLARADIAERRALLLAVAQRHVAAAETQRALAAALAAAAGNAAARSLLALVFDEESRRHVDHALFVLERLDEYHAVDAIRAALASRDPRLRAQALESLSHWEHSTLVKRLIAYLDAEPTAAERRPATPLAQVLQYAEDHGSEWLRYCANALRSDLGGTIATPT